MRCYTYVIHMKITIYTHPDCLKHRPGPQTDFAPARLMTVIQAIQNAKIPSIDWSDHISEFEAPCRMVHEPDYLDRIFKPIAPDQSILYDTDTWAADGTADALRASIGLVISAIKDVSQDKARNAFCIVSPGGHHAEADMACGFCFINHAAVGAAYAQKMQGFSKVAVIDIDAHHGNGTQNIFWNDPNKLFISLHEQRSLTGFIHETGCSDNIVNIPLPKGSNINVYLSEFEEKIAPKLRSFKPEFIIISAGFDAHKQDPMAYLGLEVSDYYELAKKISTIAKKICSGRLVAIMEGGYNLDTLGKCAVAFVSGLSVELKEKP